MTTAVGSVSAQDEAGAELVGRVDFEAVFAG